MNDLKKGDVVAQPGCFRLRFMGKMWCTQYVLQLEDGLGCWLHSSSDYTMSLEELNDSGFVYVCNDLLQMELF